MKPVTAAALIAGLVTLTACQHTEPGIEVRMVEIPVPQPCLPADQIPAEPPLIGDQLSGNAVEDLPIVAASALRLRAWGRVLAAAHIACAGGAE